VGNFLDSQTAAAAANDVGPHYLMFFLRNGLEHERRGCRLLLTAHAWQHGKYTLAIVFSYFSSLIFRALHLLLFFSHSCSVGPICI
jgi:hypothetical protein